jgi:DNA-binding beta-propeller fold protein YncE
MRLHRIVLVAAFVCAAHPLDAQRPTHPTGTILRKIPTSGHPYGVTIDDQGFVYVSKVHTNELVRVRLDASSPAEFAPLGSQPPHVAVEANGRTLFATLQGGRAVVRIDASTGETVDSVPLGSDGFNLALDPDGIHLLATAADGWAYRLRRAPLKVLDSVLVGRAPNGVAYDRVGDRVYVSSRDAGSVMALDARTLAVQQIWKLDGQLQRLALTPDDRTLFVADEGETGGVHRIDLRTRRSARIPMEGAPYGVGVSPDGARLLVLLRDQGLVRMHRLPDLELIGVIDVGGRPRNIAFTHRGDRAAVTTETAIVLIQ